MSGLPCIPLAKESSGLVQFIADLRNARARELEEKRINKELANIRLVHSKGFLVSLLMGVSFRQKFKGKLCETRENTVR